MLPLLLLALLTTNAAALATAGTASKSKANQILGTALRKYIGTI